jgi:hypothetical protein
MISVHKIQESIAACGQFHSPEPHGLIGKTNLEILSEQKSYLEMANEFLDLAVKFDIGEINIENSQSLIDTGKECAEEGLFSLPFPATYIEATLVDSTSKKRFGSVFAPASTCFDEATFEKRPEFIGGTVALNFSHNSESVPTKSPWEIHTLASVINREFTKTYHAFVSNELAENANLTTDQGEEMAAISTAILYILHTLINARGVEVQTEPAPVKLNRRRAQKNKPPLYEHHTLKIGGFSSSGRVLGVGASHASPRSHWRRGHIRTIHQGTLKQKRIAIPACLINGPGFVSKDYEISQ